jgi:hypothetical protein
VRAARQEKLRRLADPPSQLRPLPDQTAASACLPTGPTGAWNASRATPAAGSSGRVDLAGISPAAGRGLRSPTPATGPSQGLGVFIDDIEVSTGEGTTSFENGLDGWTIGQPSDSAPNSNDFGTNGRRVPRGPPCATTADNVYMGFGFEGITGACGPETM